MKRERNLETMLVISVGFLVIYYFTKTNAFLIIALVSGLIGVFSNYLSGKINWVWTKIAHILGLINGSILLSVIFFIILTPIAFLFKLTKKDNLKLHKQSGSIYVDRNHTYVAEDLQNVW
jgi:Saxitoxin biosynthesis operon protein SxtJ